MAQREEDAEMVKAHLRKYDETLACPICKTNTWEVGGPVAELEFPVTLGGTAFPLAFMVCSTCGFVRQFSWGRIMKLAGKLG
jgi:hypothetical protein